MTIPEGFDPRTADRSTYEAARYAMLRKHVQQAYAPKAVIVAAAPVHDGSAWRIGDSTTAVSAAQPAQTPAAPASASDLDALRQADALALAQRADRDMQERRDERTAQADVRAMGAGEYQAALKLALPTYARRF